MTPPNVQRTEIHVHVIADHGALARAVNSGDDTAVETVLRAEKHPEERRSRPPAT